MKKIFVTLSFVYCIIHGYAQSSYIRLGLGYGFPIASQQIGVNSTDVSTTTLDPQTQSEIPHLTTFQEVVTGSYGSGFNFYGSFGHMFSKNIGFDVSLGYNLGKKYDVVNSDNESRLNGPVSTTTYAEKSYANSIVLAPLLRLSAGESLVQPYIMAGPVFSSQKLYKEISTQSYEKNILYSGGISIGIRGVVGATLAISQRAHIFAEVSFTSMNYYADKSEITKYTENGQDMLSSLSVYERNTVYKKTLVYNSDNNVNIYDAQNTPAKALRFATAMSSIATNVGVLFNLGN